MSVLFNCNRDGANIERDQPFLSRQWCPGDYGCCTDLRGIRKPEDLSWETVWRDLHSKNLPCVCTRPDVADCGCWTARQGRQIDMQFSAQNTSYFFPEDCFRTNRERQNSIAVCYSGGGTRSASAMIGYMRALYRMTTFVRQKITTYDKAADYISTVSGGGWFQAMYAYAQWGASNGAFERTQLLGRSVFLPGDTLQELNRTVESLTMDSLFSDNFQTCGDDRSMPNLGMLGGDRVPIYIGARFQETSLVLRALSKLFLSSTPLNQFWNAVMGELFLRPYALNADAPIALNESHASNLRIRNVGIERPLYGVADDPFWIAVTTVDSLRWGLKTTPIPMHIQTPWYSGISQVMLSQDDSSPAAVGGTWVESMGAFSAVIPTSVTKQNMATNQCMPVTGYNPNPNANKQTLTRCASQTDMQWQKDQPRVHKFGSGATQLNLSQADEAKVCSLFSSTSNSVDVTITKDELMYLRDMIGPSSTAFAAALCAKHFTIIGSGGGCIGNSLIPLVNLYSPWSKDSTPARLTDGAFVDNIAILPLVARNVKHIVSFWNTASTLPTGPLAQNCSGMEDLLVLFGRYKETCVDTENKAQNAVQIFESDKFEMVLEQLKLARANRGPVFARVKLNVLENARYGVKGGYTVDLLLIMLQPSADFLSHLPDPIRDEIAPTKEFSDFPNYKTVGQNQGSVITLTERQVNLMAAYTEWCMWHPYLKVHLDDIFACASQPCQNGGTCSPAPSAPVGTCACTPGVWTGDRCETPVCPSNCGYGTCTSPATCTCQPGWITPAGASEQCMMSQCEAQCQPNSKCVGPNTCECVTGWSGPTCDQRVSP